ncbi:MAG: MFS transporter, partial [Chitinophagales bacterium]|nr:MFS transporter [Chitinophagales bacterium]
VDIYDLLLFSIVRVPSLVDLGYSGDALKSVGLFLIDMQMYGMLLGGILWGVLGDKKGRLSVLFGSIFMYSAANIANGFVYSVEAYAVWRFIAGIGLAGELGAGITLVAEKLPQHKRGLGTMIVAVVGLSGAIAAGIIAKFFDWRTCYFIGGALGLALLTLRIGVAESGMFEHAKKVNVSRGDFLSLFRDYKKLFRYLRCVFVGFPTWFTIGILVTFSPEFARALNVSGDVNAGTSIMYAYGGLVAGDLVSGLLSQRLQSRKKVMYVFLTLSGLSILLYLNANGINNILLYWLCFFLGFAHGYWVIFVTTAAEQFGTNLRATVATSVPNFARGSLVLITAMFRFFEGYTSTLTSAAIVGAICVGVAFAFLSGMRETFHADLNYLEE